MRNVWTGIRYGLVLFGAVTVLFTLWQSFRLVQHSTRVAETEQTRLIETVLLPTLTHGLVDSLEHRLATYQRLLLALGTHIEQHWHRPQRPFRNDRTDMILQIPPPASAASLTATPTFWSLVTFIPIIDQHPLIAHVYVITRKYIQVYPAANDTTFWSRISPDFRFDTLSLFRMATPEANPHRQTLWTSPYPDARGSGWVITLFRPIYVHDTYQGVVALDLRLEAFARLIRHPGLVERHGLILLFNDADQLVTGYPFHRVKEVWPEWPYQTHPPVQPYPLAEPPRLPYFTLADLATALALPRGFFADHNRGPVVHRIAQQPYWLVWQKLPRTHWSVVLLTPRTPWLTATLQADSLRRYLWLGMLSVILTVLIYTIGTIWAQTTTWKRLIQPLEAMSGDLENDRLVTIPHGGAAVVQTLARHIRRYQETAQAMLERWRHASEEIRLVLEAAQEAYVRLTTDGRIVDMNSRFEQLFQCRRTEVFQRPFMDLFIGKSRAFIQDRLQRWREEPEVIQKPVEIHTGEMRYLLFSVSPLRVGGRSTHVIVMVHDMSDYHEAEIQLSRASTTDPLTGLLNRRIFLESVELFCHRTMHQYHTFSIVLINLDSFRKILLEYGTTAGDVILRQIPKVVAWPEQAIVARYGNDEFTVLLPQTSLDMAFAWAEQTRQQIEQTEFVVNHHRIRITCSCSVVAFPEHGRTVSELLSSLYLTMDHAKQLGGNRVLTIEQSTVLRTGSVAVQVGRPAELFAALEEGRVIPFFQPIVHLQTQEIIGYEILSRLIAPDGTIIPACEFYDALETLPPFEQIQFDQRVLVQAFERLRAHSAGLIFINLSPAFIVLQQQFEDLCNQIMRAEFPPRQIVFEISERAVFRDLQGLQRMVFLAQDLGFRFAVDDFGSGFSSFQYFRMLPIDFLKVDGSYIRGIHLSLDNRRFLEAFILLAHHFGIEIIAEHVQNEADLMLIRRMGVPYGQGFLLGRPMETPIGVGEPPQTRRDEDADE